MSVTCDHGIEEDRLCAWCLSAEVMPRPRVVERVAGYDPDLAKPCLEHGQLDTRGRPVVEKPKPKRGK